LSKLQTQTKLIDEWALLKNKLLKESEFDSLIKQLLKRFYQLSAELQIANETDNLTHKKEKLIIKLNKTAQFHHQVQHQTLHQSY